MAHPVRIGCSGWVYTSWAQSFYPPRLAGARWLTHYASVFDTVELNSIGDRPERPFQTHWITADWTLVRFHHGWRGRRGNYSEAEPRAWARRIRGWSEQVDVYAYFNNDWEVFAPRNALRLRALLDVER